jgi:hypothetical protein
MSAWYLAHEDELLIDIDDPEKAARRGGTFEEEFFRKRLRAALEGERLNVAEVWRLPSSTERHLHIYVRLAGGLDPLERLVWQLHLGSDLYRGRADLMRLARKHTAPSLLIERTEIRGFYRPADFVCGCTRKHDTDEQHAMGDRACVAWRAYRGASPWELFGPTTREVEPAVRLPVGRVPLALITKRQKETARTVARKQQPAPRKRA